MIALDAVVEIDVAGDEDAATKLAALCPSWPDDHLKDEIVIVADPADFLEERRIKFGDIAMALEFGEPKLPTTPAELAEAIIAGPLVLQDDDISGALDQFEMNVETRQVRLSSVEGMVA